VIKLITTRVIVTPSPTFDLINRLLNSKEVELDYKLVVIIEKVKDSKVIITIAMSLIFYLITLITLIIEQLLRVIKVIVYIFESIDRVNININITLYYTSNK
jgi:hypothetical protein